LGLERRESSRVSFLSLKLVDTGELGHESPATSIQGSCERSGASSSGRPLRGEPQAAPVATEPAIESAEQSAGGYRIIFISPIIRWLMPPMRSFILCGGFGLPRTGR
jgi:hypothetical protein